MAVGFPMDKKHRRRLLRQVVAGAIGAIAMAMNTEFEPAKVKVSRGARRFLSVSTFLSRCGGRARTQRGIGTG